MGKHIRPKTTSINRIYLEEMYGHILDFLKEHPFYPSFYSERNPFYLKEIDSYKQLKKGEFYFCMDTKISFLVIEDLIRTNSYSEFYFGLVIVLHSDL